MNMFLKSENNPVTEVLLIITQADFKVQKMIVKSLRMIWPQLNIVAEEITDYQ